MNEIEKYEGVLACVQKEESLIKAFTQVQDKLFLFSPSEIQSWNDEKKENFLRKTIMKIAHDEKLVGCFSSNEGKISIMEAVQKSCSTGLEIGGKHAYLVPQKVNGKPTARFSIKASGYYALLCGGSKPIFKDLRWGLVYKKDAELNEKINDAILENGGEYKPIVNPATGEIYHNIPAVENRGELLGCWVQIVKMNGQKEAVYFPMNKINQWKALSKNTRDDAPWKIWPEEMSEQSCIRHACEKYEQARDLIVSSIYDDQKIDTNKPTFDKIEDALAEGEILPPEDDKPEETDDNF